jgi:putative hydrolase of HD superfamily
MRMLVIHDVVEIDAGDTFAFDPEAHHDKQDREEAAAERIFGLLPDDQGVELRALWDEFEAFETPEARFANALDRLSGILQNHRNGGGTWIEHEVTREAILARQAPIREALPELWPWVVRVVDKALGDRAGGDALGLR